MKRIVLFLTVVLCFASCNKDGSQATLQKICNRWEVTRWENYKEGVLESTQEGNFTEQLYAFSKEGTVKITKKDGSVNEYTFAYDDDTKLLTIPKLNKEYYVVSVTNKEMTWRVDGYAIGSSGMVNYQSFYYLTRK